ncbi:MAG: PilW family protein [Candidatus Thiodiazotropha sp. (ex Notomyrtea botanica)]|nr:PilW family protein [Candidatus Thiodiazotropha sp. (ex Notomyrtea botanica)]
MRKQFNYGLTLVELMIGLALSLLILGGAVSVFISSKESFRLEEDLSAMQENFRFIADRLNKDLSMVGYTGCAMPYVDNTPTVDAFVSGVGVTDVIQGVDGGANPDTLTVSFALPESGIPIIDGGATLASPLYVSRNLPLYKALSENFGSSSTVPVTLLVGNCDHANIFLVTSVTDVTTPSGFDGGSIAHATGVTIGGVSNTSTTLSDRYGATNVNTAHVFEMESVTYQITTVSGVTGLYESRNGAANQLVLDNVTDFQVLYGIDSSTSEDGNADHYVDWSNTLRISDITSLKVTLSLIVSEQDGNDITRDYTFTVKLRDMGLDV